MPMGMQSMPQYLLEESIARTVEQERLDKIYHDSRTLKQSLASLEGRCDVCTLRPPCRHNKDLPPNFKEVTEAERERKISRLLVGMFGPATNDKSKSRKTTEMSEDNNPPQPRQASSQPSVRDELTSPSKGRGSSERKASYSVQQNIKGNSSVHSSPRAFDNYNVGEP